MVDLVEISTLEKSSEGVDFSPVYPSGEKKGQEIGFTIRVLGTDSAEWRKVNRSHQNRLMARYAKAKESGEKFDISEDEQMQCDLELAIALTAGWGDLEYEGEPLGFTPDNVKNLYLSAPYLIDQVQSFAGQHENFTKG